MERAIYWRAARFALAATLIVVCCTQVSLAYTQGDPEFRAFWIDAWGAGFLNQSQVNTLLGTPGTSEKGQIRNANCNAVVVQVRRRADVCYPSGMGEPYMSGLSPSNFNALQALINAAHDTTGGKQRVEVHCWLVTFATGGGTVWSAHRGTPTGSLTTFDNYWPTRTDGGAESEDYALDPGHPECEEYLTNVCMDMVNNFDIDGIHYDYVRFTANNQGYNPTSVARYNARYGLSGQPLNSDAQWKQWRRDQISCLVRQVYAKIQSAKPWVKQSGAFVTWNPSPTSSTRSAFQATRPYYDVYSDWDAWMQEGIMDMGIPMTYYNWASLPTDYTRWMNFEKDRKFNRHMYVGPGTYLNSLSNAILEIEKTRDASPSGNYVQGFSGYSYRVPYSGGTWSGFAPSLLGICQSPVLVPAMPWKTTPTKGHMSGTVTYASGGAWVDGATVTISGPENRTQPTDGTGFYAFIDLTPGTYTLSVSKSGYTTQTRSVTVAIGGVTGNMYVNDFQLGAGPIISNVQVTSVTNNSATITWTTSQAADTQVEYGLTTSYGSFSPLNSALVTSHSVTLSGLSQKTAYHFRAHSDNGNGSATSGDYTFTTFGPPAISNVRVTSVTSTTATIAWDTDLASNSTVNYGLTASYGSQQSNSSQVTSHSIMLTGLSAATPYHYQVASSNAYGGASAGDYTFTTTDQRPVISDVQVSSITAGSAVVTWTTDVTSDSRVDYGLTTSYGSQQSNSSQVTSHSISLTGLSPKTTYHFKCTSANAYGPTSTGDYSFTTNGPPEISGVSANNITASGATITWTTDVAGDSTVNYGTTASYGSQQTNGTQVTSHSIALSGLAASTLYHYQCRSVNVYGYDDSTDYTFTTAAIPVEIIVDNLDSGWTNTSSGSHTWSSGSIAEVPKIGTNYLFHAGDGSTTESSSTCECTWRPTIPADGLYDVYAFYQKGTNRNTAAPYKVYYDGGSVTSVQNQYSSVANQGDWFLLASDVPFQAGTAGYVELTTLSTDTNNVSADAAKWVYKGGGDLTPPTIAIGAPSASVTRSGPITYAVTYGGADNVTLAAGNITLNTTGTATGTIGVSGSGTSTRTVTISSITGNGSIGISIAAGTASDTAGNQAPAAGPSTTFNVDNTAPTLAIGAPSASATSGGPVTYLITYTGADNVTLATGNVTLNKTGTANGTVAVSGSGVSSRTVTISSITGNGTLGISVAAGTASDTAGNTAAAAGPGATFNVDNVAPTIAIGAPSATQTTSGPVSYTITYGGADSIVLSEVDINLNKTGTADASIAVSGAGNTTRTVTISSISGSGTLGISIAAGTASDTASNAAAAAGPSATFSVDNGAPVMTAVTDESYTTSTATLVASWSGSDPESGITGYEYAVGTDPDTARDNIKGWNDAGTNTSATITGLSLTVGETYYISVRATNGLGLVSEPLASAGVKVAYEVSSVRAAKALEDGKPVALPATLVVSAKFPTCFYIEDSNRIAGIRVNCSSTLSPNQTVRVFGVLGLTDDGERAVLSPKLIEGSSGVAIQPLLLSCNAVGGGSLGYTPGITNAMGLNNIGLLVRIVGKVTHDVSDGFYLSDGIGPTDESGYRGIKVDLGTANPGYADSYVVVTGIVSCRRPGAVVPLILAKEITVQ